MMRKVIVICLSLALSYLSVTPATAVDLKQGWDEDKWTAWRDSSQGSRLIPQAWLRALRQPLKESDDPAAQAKKFLAADYIRSFGYRPYKPKAGEENTQGLPRGFARDIQNDTTLSYTKLRWKPEQANNEPWVGMTCAACHTGDISYQGKPMPPIFGGAPLADFQTFMAQFRLALAQTATNEVRFEQFAEDVLGEQNTAEAQGMLRTALKQLSDFYAREAQLNATPLQYGPGRLDAVGHILNKTALLAYPATPVKNPANAPVSYPFLWNVPQHDRLEYNGMVEQKLEISKPGKKGLDVGALTRNTGEVIGVFADVVTATAPGEDGFVSSINTSNLVGLEQDLETLYPPLWPQDLLGELDPEKQIRGAALFAEHCSSCHQRLARTDLNTNIVAAMIRIAPKDQPQVFGPTPGEDTPARIGTDPWMACNAYTYSGISGVLKGLEYVSPNGEPATLGRAGPLAAMLNVTIEHTLINRGSEIKKLVQQRYAGIRIPPIPSKLKDNNKSVNYLKNLAASNPITAKDRLKYCYADLDKLGVFAYKGRPLNGIWATPPYLHNGSVPNLKELLLPASARSETFYVGTTEYDPENAGYLTHPEAPGNRFEFDTTLNGNLNTGHEYGTALSEDQRADLLEYLKGS